MMPKNISQLGSSKTATDRLMSELKHISESNPQKDGYSVAPISRNLYHWELKMFGFDAKDPISNDMKLRGVKEILFHVTFPQDYPFSPPFIRVIRPRFQYLTGRSHISCFFPFLSLLKKAFFFGSRYHSRRFRLHATSLQEWMESNDHS